MDVSSGQGRARRESQEGGSRREDPEGRAQEGRPRREGLASAMKVKRVLAQHYQEEGIAMGQDGKFAASHG